MPVPTNVPARPNLPGAGGIWSRGHAPLLVAAALILIQAVVAGLNLSPLADHYTFRVLFDVNGEANLMAWLSSAVLLVIACGAGLAAIADRAAGIPRRLWMGWALVGILFVVLSADEAAGLHELIGEKAHRVLDVEGLPSLYTWVLVVAPIGLVAAILMIRWFVVGIGLRSTVGKLGTAAVGLWLAVPVLEALDPSLGGPLALSVLEESLEAVGEALLLAGVLLYLTVPGRFCALVERCGGPVESSG